MERTRHVPAAETPDAHGAFPRLSPKQVAALGRYGVHTPTETGDVLFREGDRTCDFFVILDGTVALVEDRNGQAVGLHGPGRFLGEFNLLPGQAVFLTAVVEQPGAVVVMPRTALREIAIQDRALADMILHAYLVRRSILLDLRTGFKILGSSFSPDTRRLRELAIRNRLQHRWIDLEQDPGAEALLRQLGIEPQDTPVVVWRQQVLRNPSNEELAQMIGLRVPARREAVCDLLIVGAGPAGLAAAVTGASEGLAVVALEGLTTGGQARTAARVENYPGFPAGLSGSELAELAALQATKFGAQLRVPAMATAFDSVGGQYVVGIDGGQTIRTRSVLIASGARYRKLNLAHLRDYETTSVYYAATPVEAKLYHDRPVTVVGGDNAAGQAALVLAEHARSVHLLLRENILGTGMSRYLADRVSRDTRIDVLEHTDVRDLAGDGTLEAVLVEDTWNSRRYELETSALFIFAGATPLTGWLGTRLALDDDGFVITGPEARGPSRGVRPDDRHTPAHLEASLPRIFAAGDVRSGSIKRVASAIGEGAMAAHLAHRYLG
jgi:thioredoxin reductase (NADPH)